MRLMRQFAFKGVDALVRERNSLGESFEHVAVKYFDIGRRYCLHKGEVEDFKLLFDQKLKMDIVQITDEMSPLNVAAMNDKEDTKSKRSNDWIEKANQAIDEDESDSERVDSESQEKRDEPELQEVQKEGEKHV